MSNIEYWENDKIKIEDLSDDTKLVIVSTVYKKDSGDKLIQSRGVTTVGLFKKFDEENKEYIDETLPNILIEECDEE